MKDLSKPGAWHCCVWTFTLFPYHCVDGLLLPLLQGFPGLLSTSNPFRAQAQQPTHVGSEEAPVAIKDWAIIGQDLYSRNFTALMKREAEMVALETESAYTSDIKGQ